MDLDWLLFLVFLAACGAAGSTGALFPPGPWYERLEKPPWTPPDWAFPVAWTILYLFIAAAAARVAPLPGSAYAMGFFSIQIALNALWSPVFFGLHKMKSALVVVAGLWLAVLVTLVSFWQLDRIAGLLFVPYLAWVSVAAALNARVWRLNPHPVPDPA